MATFTELIEDTKLALQDTGDVNEDRVKTLLNEALLEIAEEIDIPYLKKLTTAVTIVGQNYLTMPAGFSGKLRYVGNSDGPIKILDGGVEELLEMYPSMDGSGDVEVVALEGQILYYQYIPDEAQTLTILYYENPSTLEAEDDTPVCLPEYLHRALLVNKVAANEYKLIEDGIEGERFNTLKYRGWYEEAKQKFQEWISKRRKNIVRSRWDV